MIYGHKAQLRITYIVKYKKTTLFWQDVNTKGNISNSRVRENDLTA